jgi:carbonic anhydrase
MSEGGIKFNYLHHGHDWHHSCHEGHEQTPINIDLSSPNIVNIPDAGGYLLFNFQEIYAQAITPSGAYRIEGNLGQVTVQFPNSATIYGNIANIHFHSPSENVMNHERFDLEMHIVMQDPAKVYPYIVLGVWFKTGYNENPFIREVIASSGSQARINLSDLFYRNELDNFFQFMGSLTTPPLTEHTLWLIDPAVREISEEQHRFFFNLWKGNYSFAHGKGNNRELQPLFDRKVYYYTRTQASW